MHFFHVDVDEASRKYTAFVTETGLYEFLKVPFGWLSINSNYFQRYINYVLRELLRDGTLIIYVDDIIIPATDEKEANKKVARVLETDENIRNIKKLLPSNKTTEFILNNNALFKISEKQKLLVVPDVIKKVHSFRHFAVTKTEELVRRDYCFPNKRKCVENAIKNCVECRLASEKVQEENGRTYHRKRKKSSISERRVGNNRENSVWKQDEDMDFALMREEE
ncbi:pro-Pol polyprotein [Trichonephila clavipes]|nr:pro-Pol polyprotein [Trichonephila clavipes]